MLRCCSCPSGRGEETRTNGHINKDMGTNCDEFLEEKNACYLLNYKEVDHGRLFNKERYELRPKRRVFLQRLGEEHFSPQE